MFGTSIHWTTFFYLLIDSFILIFALIKSLNNRNTDINRYLLLAFLFVLYNLTGGFLPYDNFPGPFILQYIITYGVAIFMGVYLFYYIYKEYDISFLNFHLKISRIAIFGTLCFIFLFLLPYFITNTLNIGRILFTVPVASISLYFLWAFYHRISNPKNPNDYILRRNKLSLLGVTCMVLLPVLTVIGDYQWLTFSVVNISFFAMTAIEIDRYLYFLQNKGKMAQVYSYFGNLNSDDFNPNLITKGLTRREIEIAMAILDNRTYKEIGEDSFIAENTVSKHASNIFKKTNVKNRAEFINRFQSL